MAAARSFWFGRRFSTGQVNLVDDLAVVFLGQNEFVEPVIRVLDGLTDDRPVHHREDGAEVQTAVAAFALTGAFADRLAEEFQEAAGEVRRCYRRVATLAHLAAAPAAG